MAEVHELPEMRDRRRVFRDRGDGGRVLAGMLVSRYRGRKDAVVAAIPSGGVPVGLEVSRGLDLPLDLILVRKIQIPWNTEAGFGAMTLSGRTILNEPLTERLGLSREQIEVQELKVREELARRNELFRGGRPPADFRGAAVIVTDDGLASGYTMLVSLEEVRAAGAARVVVAVPTAHEDSLRLVGELADEVWCPNVRSGLRFAVAEAYEEWRDLTREEVILLLRSGEN